VRTTGWTVIGLPTSGHIGITASTCDTCHTAPATVSAPGGTGGFKTWNMSTHAGVNTATCNVCHGATPGVGISFTPAGGGTTSGTTVVPVFKPSNHFSTSVDCKTCHSSFTSFKVGSMTHTGIVNGCQNCHGNGVGIPFANVTPVFKPATGHIATTALDCSVCHVNTTTFTAWVMNHSGVSIATCNNCHGGQSFVTGLVPVTKAGNHLTTTQDCLKCHSTSNFSSFAGGRMGSAEHTANGNTATCIACHNGQSFQGVTPVSKPATHIVTANDCALCHLPSTYLVGGFAGQGIGWNMSHTGITLNCIQCHNGQTFATGVTPVNKGAVNHVPTNADCSNCHPSTSPGGFASFSNLSGKHTTVYMTGYSTTCTVCHGQTSQIYFGVDAQCVGKGSTISDHKSGGVCGGATKANCRSCHNATDSKW
jgi:hypothetical protein